MRKNPLRLISYREIRMSSAGAAEAIAGFAEAHSRQSVALFQG